MKCLFVCSPFVTKFNHYQTWLAKSIKQVSLRVKLLNKNLILSVFWLILGPLVILHQHWRFRKWLIIHFHLLCNTSASFVTLPWLTKTNHGESQTMDEDCWQKSDWAWLPFWCLTGNWGEHLLGISLTPIWMHIQHPVERLKPLDWWNVVSLVTGFLNKRHIFLPLSTVLLESALI